MLVAGLGSAQEQPVAPAEPEAPGARVVARYGEEVVTMDELNASIGPALLRIQQQLYQAQTDGLKGLVFERLIDAAAAKEGIPAQEYYAAQVTALVGEPPTAEVDRMIAQYKDRLPKDEAEARSTVVQYLQQRQVQAREEALRTRLFAEAGVEMMLDPPRANVEVRDYNPRRGAGDDAPVILTEYTDYQCPYCKRVQAALGIVMERYGDRVQHVFKQLPLPMHAEAKTAAIASLCAADQDQFWAMHDWLFENGANLNRDSIVAQAVAMELDGEAFTACLDDGPHGANVDMDAAEARLLGITGTPGFLVNGRLMSGAQPLDAFVTIIEDELRRAGVSTEPRAPEVAEEPAPEASGE
jgi:protein-disulfide isomerase